MSAPQRTQPQTPVNALATRDAVLPATVETASAAAAAQATAMVETRFKLALLRPRDWVKVREMIFAACDRPEFAEESMYALERSSGDKKVAITGLSVRFAEEAVRWIGNAMVESVVRYDDDEKRIIGVVVTDLEANVTYPTDVVIDKTVERRSSTGREVLGKRVNSQNQVTYRVRCTDDELREKQNSQVSRGRRNGILLLLSADLQEQAKARVRATLERAANAPESRKLAIPSMVLAFAGLEIPVTEEMLRSYLGHPVEQITPGEFATLRGLYQAVKDGETTWEAITGGKQPHRTQTRREGGIRSGGYEQGVSVKAEVKDMREAPRPQAPAPPDPYNGDGAPEPSDEEIDREIAARDIEEER